MIENVQQIIDGFKEQKENGYSEATIEIDNLINTFQEILNDYNELKISKDCAEGFITRQEKIDIFLSELIAGNIKTSDLEKIYNFNRGR